MLKFMDSIPSHAIVNEMVNLTAYIKKPELAGFVNATLKTAITKEFSIPKDEKLALSIKYSIAVDIYCYNQRKILNLETVHCLRAELGISYKPRAFYTIRIRRSRAAYSA